MPPVSVLDTLSIVYLKHYVKRYLFDIVFFQVRIVIIHTPLDNAYVLKFIVEIV